MSTQYPGVRASGRSSYAYRLRLPLDPETGKRPWEVRGGFHTAYAAHRARSKRLAQLYAGIQTTRDDRTVAQLMADWIARRMNARASTIVGWQKQAKLYINPYLGDVPVRQLTDTKLLDWITTLQTEAPNRKRGEDGVGLSERTVFKAVSVLSAVLTGEVAAGRLAINPMLTIDMPRPEHRRPKAWTSEELYRALPYLTADKLAAAWSLMLREQLRPGEVVGLARADLDLDAAALQVRRTRTIDIDDRQIIGETAKSPSSVRPIELTAATVALLKEHLAREERRRQIEPDWNQAQRIFPGRGGGILAHATLARRLRIICDKAEVRQLTPHGLRHSGATWLSRLKVPPKTISARLGHVSVAFTLDNYVTADTEDDRAASDQIDAMTQRQEEVVTSDVTFGDIHEAFAQPGEDF